jgi:hypothetical protein
LGNSNVEFIFMHLGIMAWREWENANEGLRLVLPKFE